MHKCRFTLKRVRDMIRTYIQMDRTDKYSQHSSIIWPVWLNGWVIVYEVSDCGFESRSSHLDIIWSSLRPPELINYQIWTSYKIFLNLKYFFHLFGWLHFFIRVLKSNCMLLSYHVRFQNKSTLYSCLNVKELLAWNRCDIWILTLSNFLEI